MSRDKGGTIVIYTQRLRAILAETVAFCNTVQPTEPWDFEKDHWHFRATPPERPGGKWQVYCTIIERVDYEEPEIKGRGW